MRRNPPRFPESRPPLPKNLTFVLGISPSAMTLGLRNMRELVRALEHPEKRFRSVIVAGTNGKGSVSDYLAAILRHSGVRVGLYSSPHIYDVTERIRVDGVPVDLDTMERAAERIVPLHDRIQYSYFEALTAIAFLVFAEREVDIAVLETGLGGRFDATNIVDPEISVLTSIGLDHRRILGDTHEEILREKLGVTRPDVPFFIGPLPQDLTRLVEERARQNGIPLVEFDTLGTIEKEEMSLERMSASVRTPHRDYGSVRLPFIGDHQIDNALISIGVSEKLAGPITNLSDVANDISLTGRFEVLGVGKKHVILDVAHNDDALIATIETLATLSPRAKNAMVLGILDRKELIEFPCKISKAIQRLYVVQPDPDEWTASAVLLERIGLTNVRDRGMDIVLQNGSGKAVDWDRFLAQVLGDASPHDAVIFTGSHRAVEFFGRRLPGRVF